MTHNNKARRNRRQFLKNCAAVSLLGSGASAMNGKLGMIGSALAASSDYTAISDYKSLVCVFLYGGSDSFNMFVPTEDAAYNRYASSRSALAVPKNELLVGDTDTGIGFNPLLSDLHDMYTAGNMAVLANVGNLIAPITKAEFQLEVPHPNKPNDLFAHNHQQEQWLKGLSSSPASLVGSGWGGRMADLLQQANTATLPPSFSVAGSNFWLPGDDIQPIGLNPVTGLSLLSYFDDSAAGALDDMLAQQYAHPLKQQAASSFKLAKSASTQINTALEASVITSPYNAESRLAAQLRMVARMIKKRESLGMRRQIFFVGAGGWDTHDNQGPRLNALLADLNQSLTDFQNTLVDMQIDDSVTTFTASDFGRTLTINGDGSDHGWGGHYMVIGGAVKGGQLYGTQPSYESGADDDSGDKGRVIPSLSINQYGAVLAKWMGVASDDISTVFPDLSNFESDWETLLPIFDPPVVPTI